MNQHGTQCHDEGLGLIHDENIEKIFYSSLHNEPTWRQAHLAYATDHRLLALSSSDPLTKVVLADGIQNSLGTGAFSRVYAIDDRWVLKLSRDWTTLQVMKSLQEYSTCFPKVQRVIRDQAVFDNVVYHAAVVERLEDTFPVWVRSVVDGYRRPFRVDSAALAHARLNIVSYKIASGDIVVPARYVEDYSKATQLLADICLHEKCIADLRYEGNFMMRKNGEVVISDPAHPQSAFG